MRTRAWTWCLAGALVLGLAVYVLWPVSAQASRRLVRHWPEDAALRLRVDDMIQEVADGRVQVNSLSRPASAEAIDALRRRWLFLRWQERVEGVAADELSAYGIDGSRRLEVAGQAWQWGRRRDVTWVHAVDEGLLYAVGDATLFAALERAAVRLDHPALITAGFDKLVVIDGRAVAWDRSRGWRLEDEPWRPAFDGRVARLREVMDAVRLDDLAGVQPHPQAQVLMRIDLGPAADLSAHIVFSGYDDLIWVAVDDLPVQVVANDIWQRFEQLAEVWGEDLLFDLVVPFLDQPLRRIVVERGGERHLELEFSDMLDHEDIRSRWNVIWPGGMVQGDEALGERWFAVLNAIVLDTVVADDSLREAPVADDAQAVTLRINGLRMSDTWLHIDGDAVAAPGYRGRSGSIPELLRNPTLAECIDPHLLRVEPERIEAMQRVTVTDQQHTDATVLRHSDGLWRLVTVEERDGVRQVRPPAPVDPLLVERLQRVLLRSPVRPLGMATEVDRAIWDEPGDRRLRVGIAAIEQIESLERSRLEDTLPRTWAIALRRAEDGGWRAVVEDQELVYHLDDEMVEELFAPIDRPLVLPVLPAHIQVLTVVDPAADGPAYRLSRHGDDWQMEVDGRHEAADARAVRRLLRALTGLEYVAHDPGAVAVGRDLERVTAVITVRVAGIEAAGETLSLAIDRSGDPDGPVPVTLSADSARAQVRPGRLLVPAAALAEVLVPAGHLRPWEAP